jgi:hypothetical protein
VNCIKIEEIYGHRLQLTTSFNGRKTKEEGGEDASSCLSVCLPFFFSVGNNQIN